MSSIAKNYWKQKTGINLEHNTSSVSYDMLYCRSKREIKKSYEIKAEIKPNFKILMFNFCQDRFSTSTD